MGVGQLLSRIPYRLKFLDISVEDAFKDVDQQSRSGEEIAGEHADGPAVLVHGVQEEIPPSQRGQSSQAS